MKLKFYIVSFSLFATFLSTYSLALAFPDNDLTLLAWVALVPLLIAITDRNPIYGYFLTALFCSFFFAGIGDWLFTVRGYAFLHHIFFGVYLGAIGGLFGLSFSLLSRRWGPAPALMVSPFLWVSIEYIRGNLSFLSFPWGFLAHSQYQAQKIIQISSITGTYGISFLIILVNSAFAAMVLYLLNQPKKIKALVHAPISKQGVICLVGTAAVFTAVTIFYGHMALSEPIPEEGIKVSIVQGNIEQAKKWDRRYAGLIMRTYADLSRQASETNPELIVWPEAATPNAIDLDRRLYSRVKLIAETTGTSLLLGSSSRQKFQAGGGRRIERHNSAFLISPHTASDNQRYDKIRLLPFGEYLPLEGIIPWSMIDVPNIASYSPGTEFTVFQCPTFRFGVTICWESIFPDLVRQFVKKGAQFLVNITNEAWFGKSAAPYQMLSMCTFRAVENGIFVVRCANTGVSCFIDPRGGIVGRVKDTEGKDIFVQGVMTETVIPLETKTIYTRYGDWLGWLSLVVSAASLIFAFSSKTPKPSSNWTPPGF